MKKVLTIILKKLRSLKWVLSWRFVASDIHENPYYLEMNKKGLLVVPHADDELFGAFQLLNKADNLFLVYCGMIGSAKDEIIRNKRQQEFQQFCKSQEIVYFEVDNLEKELPTLIYENEIEVVFSPSFIDWHPEHRQVSKTVIEILKKMQKPIQLIWYSVTVPLDGHNSILVPMSKKEQKRKYTAFKKIYKSQKGMPITRFIAQEKVNGKKRGCFSAEIFYPVEYDVIEKLSRLEFEFDSLKNHINDIKKIRNTVHDILDSL